MIIGKTISLRVTKLTDVPKIFEWENNPENWQVSETDRAYTFEEINLLLQSSEDIYENGQLRFLIVSNLNFELIGTLDLFQCDFEEKSVHLGILIADKQNRRRGYAEEAINLASDYCSNKLLINEIICSIQAENIPSLELFKKCGFQKIEEEKENPIFDSKSDKVVKMKLWLKK